MFDVIIGGGGGVGHPCLLPQKSIVGSVVRGRRRRRRRSRGAQTVASIPGPVQGQRGMEGVMCCNMCCPPFKFEPAVSNSVLQPVCIGFCTHTQKDKIIKLHGVNLSVSKPTQQKQRTAKRGEIVKCEISAQTTLTLLPFNHSNPKQNFPV